MEADTQHLHASVGLYLSMMPRSMAWMCDAVVATNRPLIVLDAMQDSRYRHSPLVRNHHVRFYAAVPVATSNGWVLGTLAVMDTTPREYVDIEPLVALAGSIMTFLRKAKAKARKRRTLSFDSAVNPAPGGLRSREANSESMIMTLVSNTAQTQVTLAEQQGALASALGDHTDKISRLVQAIARMESKLGRNDVQVDDDGTKLNHV
ncbi:hypothetical protein B5M09_003517 [Aphanomyces astaci]|uniref:GAF domain-containing protein n=1 Tax=Aphanomyces astaci TaxID=112090 RepID=A0A425C6M1_APHAT|nr:hypothetical protein B5M09_003517 [Aphanomyces astaci]